MCIDYFASSHLNDVWSAYITPLGPKQDLSSTYHPTYSQEYAEVAYLFSQLTSSATTRTNIQEAAWTVMAYGITDLSYTKQIADNSYIDSALANYNTVNLSNFEIISDSTQREQEFIAAVTPTPEPASVWLLGSVLSSAAGLAFWRRRKQA